MLRDLKHSRLGCVLTPFKVTANGGSVTASYGGNNFSSLTSGSTGVSTLVLRKPSHRENGSEAENLLFGTIENAAAPGYYVDYAGTVPTNTTIATRARSAAGTATDNILIHGLCASWQSPNTDLVSPLALVGSPFVKTRMMGFRITSSNTIAQGGTQGSLSATATGIRRLTFTRAFAEAPVVLVTPISTTQKSAQVKNVTGAYVDILTQDINEADADIDCYVVVVGHDGVGGGAGTAISSYQVPQRKPRLILGAFTTAPAPVVGSGDFTVASNGAGDRTITFTTPFKRAPEVLIICASSRAQVHTAATTSAVRILSSNSAGAASTDATLFLAMGYDDAVEY